MKKKNIFIGFLLVLSFCFVSMFSLFACGTQTPKADDSNKDDQEQTTNISSSNVMTVSVNPSIEFVVDGSGKVVAVNAVNEEGNYIKVSVQFEGKTSKEAVEALLSVLKEKGYLEQEDLQIEMNYTDETALSTIQAYAQAKLGELDVSATIMLKVKILMNSKQLQKSA